MPVWLEFTQHIHCIKLKRYASGIERKPISAGIEFLDKYLVLRSRDKE